MLAIRYLEKGLELLQRLQETQLGNIQQAADIIAQAVADGHTLYAWGGPHSSLPVQDIFWRAGGLALVNPIFTPRRINDPGDGRLFRISRHPMYLGFVSGSDRDRCSAGIPSAVCRHSRLCPPDG
jgi:hypothetical protein